MNASGAYPMILLSVVMSAAAQMALKAGMASAQVQGALAGPFRLFTLTHVLFHPMVLLGLFCYVASMGFWLFVLSRMEVSSAYPFVAVAIVLTAIGGKLLFHDSFSAAKIVGTLLIVLGVVALARG